MLVVYGIKNCDTVKKARRWLDEQGVAYRFHDFRADGLDVARLQRWSERLGWEVLLNRKGTTWRGLPEAAREHLDEAGALRLMLDQPALIKRPVFERGDQAMVRFVPELLRGSPLLR